MVEPLLLLSLSSPISLFLLFLFLFLFRGSVLLSLVGPSFYLLSSMDELGFYFDPHG
jgi:hypothetical protein